MRYIPLSHLRDGMVLGQSMYGKKYEILLVKGVKLTASHIQRIDSLGYHGAYIDDSLSADLDVRPLIPAELRLHTVKAAHEFLEQTKVGFPAKGGSRVTAQRQKKLLSPLISAILDAPNRFVDMVDLKPFENYSSYHATNVCILSLLMGLDMGITGQPLYDLGMAALVHDVGNAFVPQELLDKAGPLTPEEFKIVQSHTELGFNCLRQNYDISIDACLGALQHHENYDGTGYPNQIRGDKISIKGRIIAVADVFDSMISRRPFRAPLPHAEALHFIHRRSGAQFDPEMVASLERVAAFYPTGTCVELNTRTSCIVVKNNARQLDRPLLLLLNNLSGPKMYIDLADPKYRNTYIRETLEYWEDASL